MESPKQFLSRRHLDPPVASRCATPALAALHCATLRHTALQCAASRAKDAASWTNRLGRRTKRATRAQLYAFRRKAPAGLRRQQALGAGRLAPVFSQQRCEKHGQQTRNVRHFRRSSPRYLMSIFGRRMNSDVV